MQLGKEREYVTGGITREHVCQMTNLPEEIQPRPAEGRARGGLVWQLQLGDKTRRHDETEDSTKQTDETTGRTHTDRQRHRGTGIKGEWRELHRRME